MAIVLLTCYPESWGPAHPRWYDQLAHGTTLAVCLQKLGDESGFCVTAECGSSQCVSRSLLALAHMEEVRQEGDNASAPTWAKYDSMQEEEDDAAFLWKKYGSKQEQGGDAAFT